MATITIKDIARELEFSISTVSRALQNHPDISEETKRKVMAYAREHHYRPNQLASSLRTQKNTTIGVLLPELTAYFFGSILTGAEKAANEAGYNILIARTKEDPDREQQCLQMLCNSRVAGIIACPTKRTTDFSAYKDVIESGIPLVIVDREAPLDCDQVVSDDFSGAFQATEYLIQTGCKRIVMFSSSFNTYPVLERQRGFREALLRYGIPFDDSRILRCEEGEELVRRASSLLGTPDCPDAIFCSNDKIADSIIFVAKMKHIRIPDELSICGFSNNQFTRRTDPMQTTVEQYGKRIGKEAVGCLLSRLDSKDTPAPAQHIAIPTDLIVRETTH